MKHIEETPDMMYGALKTDLDTTGLTLVKSLHNFKRLLEDDRWMKVGKGFDDINKFLETIDLSDIKFKIEERKEVAKLLAEKQASQRKTAEALGVAQATITRDLKKDEPNGSPDEFIDFEDIDFEDVTNEDEPNGSPDVQNGTPDENTQITPPTTKELFEKSIKNEEKKEQKQAEKEAKKQEYLDRVFTKSSNESVIDIFDTDKKFRIIYADPAWSYNDKQNTDKLGGAEKHYDTMNISQLSELPINEISEKDSVLFLWVTSPLLEDAFKVVNAWGFKYKTSFIWDKVKHNMGHYNSVRHEFLLICTKGSATPDNKKLYDSVQSIERNDNHSEKPIEFMNIIDDLYTYGNRIELFARAIKKDNWYGWGNEL